MSASDDEDVLRQGWADFCDELKRAGEIPFRATVPPHVNDRTAGFEVLARNISLALNFQHDYADPLHPDSHFQTSCEGPLPIVEHVGDREP